MAWVRRVMLAVEPEAVDGAYRRLVTAAEKLGQWSRRRRDGASSGTVSLPAAEVEAVAEDVLQTASLLAAMGLDAEEVVEQGGEQWVWRDG